MHGLAKRIGQHRSRFDVDGGQDIGVRDLEWTPAVDYGIGIHPEYEGGKDEGKNQAVTELHSGKVNTSDNGTYLGGRC